MFWLLACLTPNDDALHAQALQAGADADCQQLRSEDLRQDCRVWRAVHLVKLGQLPAAKAICADLEAGSWRGECWFLLADYSGAVREEAQVICSQSEPFYTECIDHAIQRLAEQLLETPGTEPEAYEELSALWGRDHGDKVGGERAMQMVSGLLELRPPPLTRASFGNASEPMIQMALTHYLSKHACSTAGLDLETFKGEVDQAMLAAQRTRQCNRPTLSGPRPQ